MIGMQIDQLFGFVTHWETGGRSCLCFQPYLYVCCQEPGHGSDVFTDLTIGTDGMFICTFLSEYTHTLVVILKYVL